MWLGCSALRHPITDSAYDGACSLFYHESMPPNKAVVSNFWPYVTESLVVASEASWGHSIAGPPQAHPKRKRELRRIPYQRFGGRKGGYTGFYSPEPPLALEGFYMEGER